MINLPDVFERSDGYHAACYKNFTAFSFQAENTTVPHKPKGNSFTRSKLKKTKQRPQPVVFLHCVFFATKAEKRLRVAGGI